MGTARLTAGRRKAATVVRSMVEGSDTGDSSVEGSMGMAIEEEFEC